jgi:hypothetical protein
MKYSNHNNSGRSIIHQFSKEGKHYIGGKRWDFAKPQQIQITEVLCLQ